MTKRSSLVWLAALLLGIALPGHAKGQELGPDARRVVDYLLEDWQRQFSSTTIPHAIEWLGPDVDDDLRLEVVEYLRDRDELARNLQFWGANNYLFSNLEKRLAKFLILAHERGGRTPDVEEATTALGVEPASLRERLAFMSAAGFLRAAGNDLGYELAAGYKRWAGPLQHNYHTVYIEGEAPLDVW